MSRKISRKDSRETAILKDLGFVRRPGLEGFESALRPPAAEKPVGDPGIASLKDLGYFRRPGL